MAILAGSIAGKALAGASRIGLAKSSVQKASRGSMGKVEDISTIKFEGFTNAAKLSAAYGAYEAQKGGRKVVGRARRKYF